MYWADKFADEIISSGKYKPYWVDDMKTPSGRVHIGAIRTLLTHELTYRALKDQGVEVNFSYVFEDHDPFDKIPFYLDQEKYKEHLGKPLYKVPSPEPGYANYGQRWAMEYQAAFDYVGAKPKIIWGSELYSSGKMNELVITCLDKADIIRKIYGELYDEPKANDWFPFEAICEQCGKMTTTETYAWDGKDISYRCLSSKVDYTTGCGYEGKISPLNGNGKLPWKVEWPCKWKAIGVTVEGGGKDHMSAGGSHDFAKLMCKKVVNYPVPFAVAHEFFLIGGKKMSSSKGTGVSAKEIAEIVPANLMRFIVARVRYNLAINFDPKGNTIPRLFDDYDKAAEAYWNKTNKDLGRVFELSQVNGRPPEKHFLPRFSDVANYLQDSKINLVEKFEEIKGGPLSEFEKEVLNERTKYARIWLTDYAPRDEVFSITTEIPEEARSLSSVQKEYLSKVVEILNKNKDNPEELQTQLYELSKVLKIPAKEAFAAIYLSLIGKTHGPKAAWLLLGNVDTSKKRLEGVIKLETEKAVKQTPSKDGYFVSKEVAEAFPGVSFAYTVISGVNIKSKDAKLEESKIALVKEKSKLTYEDIRAIKPVATYIAMLKKTKVDTGSRRPSPEALLRRIAQGKELYTINTAVDAYNLAVIETGVGLGGFDYDKVTPPVTLRFSKDGEEMHLLGDDEPSKTKEGELVYSDSEKLLTLDLNYRDIDKTKITLETKNIILFADGGPGISSKEIEDALKKGAKYIQQFCGGETGEITTVS